MATQVKTVLGRPGLGLHISSTIAAGGAEHGVGCESRLARPDGTLLHFHHCQNYCSDTWSSVVAAINNQQVVSTLLSVEFSASEA